MVRLYGDVLDIERGAAVVKASGLQVSRTAPAGVATVDFKAVVSGQVKGGDGIVLVLGHNTKGLFARIDGPAPARRKWAACRSGAAPTTPTSPHPPPGSAR